jgi:hypothetical protein
MIKVSPLRGFGILLNMLSYKGYAPMEFPPDTHSSHGWIPYNFVMTRTNFLETRRQIKGVEDDLLRSVAELIVP